jgi:hypothetical protein
LSAPSATPIEAVRIANAKISADMPSLPVLAHFLREQREADRLVSGVPRVADQAVKKLIR